MTIAVITPIPEEFHGILKVFDQGWQSHTRRRAGRIEVCEYRNGEVIVAQGGIGKVQFGITALHLLDNLSDLCLVICAGVAGSLARTINVGDVVIGTASVEHDFRPSAPDPPLPRFDGSAQHIFAIRQMSTLGKTSFGVHFGPIASGDEAIVDPLRASELGRKTGALAVAWEGAGGARAAAFSEVPYLEIRGISDMSDYGASNTWMANLPTAIRNVALMIFGLAEALDPAESPSQK